MGERYVIRNYGPSRNLPWKRSYIYIERDGVRGTDDLAMAEEFARFPQITVSERGAREIKPPGQATGPPVPDAPPPIDKDETEITESPESVEGSETVDVAMAIDYSLLLVKDLREICEERDISTEGLLKQDLIAALEDHDEPAAPEEQDEDPTLDDSSPPESTVEDEAEDE